MVWDTLNPQSVYCCVLVLARNNDSSGCRHGRRMILKYVLTLHYTIHPEVYAHAVAHFRIWYAYAQVYGPRSRVQRKSQECCQSLHNAVAYAIYIFLCLFFKTLLSLYSMYDWWSADCSLRLIEWPWFQCKVRAGQFMSFTGLNSGTCFPFTYAMSTFEGSCAILA